MINEVYMGRTGDEVIVRTDDFDYQLAVRQIGDTQVYEGIQVPTWASELWRRDTHLMKLYGFTRHKTRIGWRIRWRDKGLSMNPEDAAEISKPDYMQDWYKNLYDEFEDDFASRQTDFPRHSGVTSRESDYNRYLAEGGV